VNERIELLVLEKLEEAIRMDNRLGLEFEAGGGQGLHFHD
jgi:hypothetical protein